MITRFNLLIASKMFNNEDDASQALCNINMEPVYADFDFHYEHDFVVDILPLVKTRGFSVLHTIIPNQRKYHVQP